MNLIDILSSSLLGVNFLIWLLAVFFVILWMMFFREKAGRLFPNELMKRYSSPPFLIILLWGIRATMIVLLTILFGRDSIHLPDFSHLSSSSDTATIITLDISQSMETDDILPSRIEFAKSIIREHTKSLENLGIIIFAGKTFVLSPITSDTSGLNYLIETLSTNTINQSEAETSGTNIGDALIQASTLFDNRTKEKKVILITDGRANIGLDPLIAADELKKKGITVSILALGSSSWSSLTHLVDGRRELLLDGSGNTINGSVDITSLESIAKTTSGKLIHISKEEEKEKTREIFDSEKAHWDSEFLSLLTDRFIVFSLVVLGLVHLILSFFFWGLYKTR